MTQFLIGLIGGLGVGMAIGLTVSFIDEWVHDRSRRHDEEIRRMKECG